MIYIINFDIKQKEIDKLIIPKFENIIINCLEYSSKTLHFHIQEIIGNSDYNNMTHMKRRYYIYNSYIMTNKLIDVIFKNYRKFIYVINVKNTQERYIYNKYKGKYRYYNGCSFNFSMGDMKLYLKKLMFLKENRNNINNEGIDIQMKYISKFISYNMIYTNLSEKQLLTNIELLMNIDKFIYNIKNEYIFNIIINNFFVPDYSSLIKFPPKHKKIIKKKNKVMDELKDKYNGDIMKMAQDKMVSYFNKDGNIFSPMKTNNNKDVMSLI